jgi:hypothetical protein
MLIVLRCLACLCLGCLWDFGLSVGCEVSLVRFGVSSNEAYEFRGVCFRISRNALAVCCLLSFAMLACVIL